MDASLLTQVMELQEACQIHQGLVHGRTNSLHDMKAIVKTWRNRLPVIADDLSHWSDIFTWRQHHYQFIVNHYNDSSENQVCIHSTNFVIFCLSSYSFLFFFFICHISSSLFVSLADGIYYIVYF